LPKLLTDRTYLPELLEEIRKARQRIEARIFLIDPGTPQRSPLEPIFDSLHAAKKRGVEIALETAGIFRSKPSGERLIRFARQRGIPLQWRGSGDFLHEKSVVFDGKNYLVGSHNWTSASLLENHEVTLKFNSEEAVLLDASDFRRELLKAIRNAQEEITLASYEISHIVESDSDFADELTRQLIFARMKQRKVRVLLDASLVRQAGGKGSDVILYRGRSKAEELARWKVHVYYDTTDSLFHAKLAVIDGETVFVGSQNLNPRRDGEVEKTATLKSKPLAQEIKHYLARIFRTAQRFRYDPLKLSGVRIRQGWVRRGGVIANIFQRRGKRTLDLLLALLHEAQRLRSHQIPWEEKRMAELAAIEVPRRFTPSVKDRSRYFQRTLTQPRIFLDHFHHLLRYDPAKKKIRLFKGRGKLYTIPEKDFFVLPWDYWTKGWHRRFSTGERYAYLIHLAEVSHSPEAPVWSSLAVRKIALRYGISWQRFSRQTVRLERLNVIEVDRDIKIGDPNAPKRANRYRVNALWSAEERGSAFQRLAEELMASPVDFTRARRLAGILNQPNDPEVIRKFLILIERYGPANVEKATRLTARFRPHFALRNVHHTGGILRNWERGIRR